ncbi:MAG: ATP-binding protein, partial [Spirochaetota bacterium]|nr:ATP-binding protein [Spirochaetota bacterium]
NLLINAKQAMENHGTISITAINIEYTENNPITKSGNYVKIVITDSGKGIKTENIEQIFDPYYSTKKNGTGLGLAIINSIIKNHDGYIFVDSIYGEGTTFSILLPGLSK